AALKVATPDGSVASPVIRRLSGRTYALKENERGFKELTLEFARDLCRIRIRNSIGEHTIACRLDGGWQRNTSRLLDNQPETVGAAAAWTAVDTFTISFRRIETPYCQTFSFRFGRERLRLSIRHNVQLRPRPEPDILGAAIEPPASRESTFRC